MENNYDEKLELPPGFRFHPTDEELITHYLSQKVIDTCFCATAIGEADLNKCEPWDLPWRAKMGEKEWYFFCVRDRKYPTGLRTNRATDAGYWKATGKDKEIYKAKTLVGMKKTLVFYKGRAPKGTKSNWVMHEYRLEGKYSAYNLPITAKNEWVICRVFQKNSGGKKTHISGLVRLNTNGNELKSSSSFSLPPLMNSPLDNSETENHKQQDHLIDSFLVSSNNNIFQSSAFSSQIHPDSHLMQDNSILKMLGQRSKLSQENSGQSPGMCNSGVINPELGQISFDDGSVDLDCLWSY